MSSLSVLPLGRISPNKILELQRAEEAEVFVGDESCNSLPDLQIVEPGDNNEQTFQDHHHKKLEENEQDVKQQDNNTKKTGKKSRMVELFQDSSLQDRSNTLRLKSQKATERIKQRSQSASRALVTKSRSFISNVRNGTASSSPDRRRKPSSGSLHIDEENLSENTRGRPRIRGQ